jgi:hypothetical protein
MFPESYLSDLRSNGPIVQMPNWQTLSSPLSLTPNHGSAAAGNTQSEVPFGPGEHSDSLNPEPGHHPQDGPLNPSRPGRPRALDENKKATVCNLVAAGVSLRQAAQFVDCDRRSIRREAQRNGAFRRQLAKARSEASIHPLQTLRQAAKTNWRAALCWMERLDPERFARPDASVVTQRESNQFAVNLVEAIEKTVSNPSERGDLFEMLSAVMPAAMRRRWEGRRLRGKVEQRKVAEDQRRGLERQQRDGRRFELFREIGRYLPYELYHKLHGNVDLLDPEEVFADGPQESDPAVPAAEQDDATANDSSTSEGSTNPDSTDREPPCDERSRAGLPNIAPPGDSFVPPPGRNSDNFAPPPDANRQPANDLQ